MSLSSMVHEQQYQNQSAPGGVKHVTEAYSMSIYDNVLIMTNMKSMLHIWIDIIYIILDINMIKI